MPFVCAQNIITIAEKSRLLIKKLKVKVQQDKLILPCDQIIKNRGATQKI